MRPALLARTIIVFLFLPAALLFSASQGGANGGGKNSGKASDSSSKSPDSGGDKSGQSGQSGITGGGFSMESEILAYEALNAEADHIAAEIASVVMTGNTDPPYTVVIATDKDMTNFLEWRSAMGQLQLLTLWAESLVDNPVSLDLPQTPNNLMFFGGIGDVQTAVSIVKDLATAFAVNETVVGVPGAIKDTPLLNVVARKLNAKKIRVLVPSQYLPGLFASSDLDGTILLQKLSALDQDRQRVVNQLQLSAAQLDRATKIVKDPASAEEQKKRARDVIAYVKNLSDILAAIDAFKSNLFLSPSDSAQSTQSKNAAADIKQTDAEKNKSADPTRPTAPATTTTKSVSPKGTPIANLIAADLLARGILGQQSYVSADFSNVHVLTLQSLESGGALLARGNLFTGNRAYFSGGAVTTFSLFRMEGGHVECGGNAFAYSGYFREKNVAKEINTSVPKLPKQLIDQGSDCLPATRALRQRPTEDQLLQQRMDKLRERILLMQQQLTQLPGAEQQQQLRNAIEQLQGEMKTLENMLKARDSAPKPQ